MPQTKRTTNRTANVRKSTAPATRGGRAAKSVPTRTRRAAKKSAPPPINLPRINFGSMSMDRKLDILGVILALIGLLTLLSLLSSRQGAVTGAWVVLIRQFGGLGAFVLPLVLVLMGIWLVLRNVERLPVVSAERTSGLILFYLNVLGWLHLLTGGGWELAQAGMGGGYIGAFSERILVGALGRAGAMVVLAAWSLIALALTLDVPVSEIFRFFQNGLASFVRRVNSRLDADRILAEQRRIEAEREPISELPSDYQPFGQSSQPAAPGRIIPLPADTGGTQPAPAATRPRGTRATASSPNASIPAAASAHTAHPPVTHGTAALPPWQQPSIEEMLEPGEAEAIYDPKNDPRARLIEDTLASFSAPVKVVATNRGPTVTQFGVKPLYLETRNGQVRVRVSKIVALADDLALALAAPRIRIQAPVPGREYVGIEVPNMEVTRVMLREVMESEPFRKIKSPLRFALGKDVSGAARCYDLAAMPHLLIAGTTGAGKSVLVNAILSCLLVNNTPTHLRMILVDPKRVELTGYNGIPHLLAPVIVEAEQVIGALQWVQREMDARYHRFSQVGARNIVDYNSKNSPPLPYMLVLIDELADLMMLAPDETERSLTRLAQLARATGIHLVLATQRPSVDVVTGLIKANFPARVAFAVASNTDSRVILDQPGAERLLGRGDMLFQAPDAAAPVRLQGVWVSDGEIQRIVDYWRQQAYDLRNVNIQSSTATPVNMDVPLNAPLSQKPLWENGSSKQGDPVFDEAVRIVREEGKASISMLQRRMRIGYTRAARMIEEMETQGIVGPAVSASQLREVLDFGEGHDSETEASVE